MKAKTVLALLLVVLVSPTTSVFADPDDGNGTVSAGAAKTERPLFRVDSEGNVYATAFIQVCANGVEFYRDQDNDGFGAPGTPVIACSAMGYVSNDADCDDEDPAIHPGAEKTDAACADGIDNDCDGFVDCDDFDCDCAPACGGTGCGS